MKYINTNNNYKMKFKIKFKCKHIQLNFSKKKF